jgi:protocatechuate 3,4-dioxygenase beta subunit
MPPVALGESIASEGKGEYLYVVGRVLDTSGRPVPDAVIETWETDENGKLYSLRASKMFSLL